MPQLLMYTDARHLSCQIVSWLSLAGFSRATRPPSARTGRLGLRGGCITFAEEREAGDAARDKVARDLVELPLQLAHKLGGLVGFLAVLTRAMERSDRLHK